MLPDRVSNPGPLTYESGALPIALRGPARSTQGRDLYDSILNGQPSEMQMIGMKRYCPAGLCRKNDVVLTSMRRHDIASTLIRRHFCTKCPPGATHNSSLMSTSFYCTHSYTCVRTYGHEHFISVR